MNKNVADDGSQEWLDQKVFQRIRAQPQHSQRSLSNSYLDQKVSTLKQNTYNQEQITDPYIKTVVNRYMNAPDYGPAHLGGKTVDRETARNFAVNADVDGISQAIQSRVHQMQASSGQAMYVEEQLNHVPQHLRNQVATINQSLEKGQMPFPQYNLARLHEIGNSNMQQSPTRGLLLDNRNPNMNNQNQQFPQQTYQINNQQQPSPRILEGFPCYVGIQYESFGGTIPLVRALGQIDSRLASQQYTIKGIVKAYIVPPQQSAVNMELLQRSPHLLTELVELIAPPMSQIRGILVPKEAIANPLSGQRTNNNQNGYQLLTDARQRTLQQNNTHQQQNIKPQTLATNPLGKKMLLG